MKFVDLSGEHLQGQTAAYLLAGGRRPLSVPQWQRAGCECDVLIHVRLIEDAYTLVQEPMDQPDPTRDHPLPAGDAAGACSPELLSIAFRTY